MKKYERLTSDFIKNDLKIDISEKILTDSFNTHWHEFYEIEFVISGTAVYTINGVEFCAKQGDLFVITPIDFHSVQIKHGNSLKIINIMFDGRLIDEDIMLELIKTRVSKINLTENDFENMNRLCSLMTFERRENAYHEIFMKNILNCVVLLVLRKMNATAASYTDTALFSQRASYYVQLNFRHGITLDEVAGFVGLNKTYLSEIFHRDIGMTLKNYITNMRLDYAGKLLSFSDFNIIEICFESGYNDFSNFSRAFKKKFGISPSAYRKNINAQSERLNRIETRRGSD